MNKALIASLSLIAAAVSQAANAQSSVTLYGTLDTGIDYISNQKAATGGHSAWGVQSGNVSTDRWGLRGTEDLGGAPAFHVRKYQSPNHSQAQAIEKHGRHFEKRRHHSKKNQRDPGCSYETQYRPRPVGVLHFGNYFNADEL